MGSPDHEFFCPFKKTCVVASFLVYSYNSTCLGTCEYINNQCSTLLWLPVTDSAKSSDCRCMHEAMSPNSAKASDCRCMHEAMSSNSAKSSDCRCMHEAMSSNSAKASDCRCMHEAMSSNSQGHWRNLEVSMHVI